MSTCKPNLWHATLPRRVSVREWFVAGMPVFVDRIVHAVERQVTEVEHEIGHRASNVIDDCVPVCIGLGGPP